MPYITSIIKLRSSRDYHALRSSWIRNQKPSDLGNLLKKFFPKTNLPIYDLYFLFPRGSYVCIKRSTRTELLIDCFSKDVRGCMMDFSTALRRLHDTCDYVVDMVDFVNEQPSLFNAFLKALFRGGILLFMVPILVESFIPVYLKLYVYLIFAIIYTILDTLYYWRKTRE